MGENFLTSIFNYNRFLFYFESNLTLRADVSLTNLKILRKGINALHVWVVLRTYEWTM